MSRLCCFESLLCCLVSPLCCLTTLNCCRWIRNRFTMVSAVKWVDEVIRNTPYEINEEFMAELFTKHKIDFIVHGDDACLLPVCTNQNLPNLVERLNVCSMYRLQEDVKLYLNGPHATTRYETSLPIKEKCTISSVRPAISSSAFPSQRFHPFVSRVPYLC
jgi:glycerol-3-phosphate cytidylyltransferase-like family protein